MFRAVKLEGAARRGCAHFFGNIGKTDIVSDNGVFKLYPRINGADAFDPSPPVLYNTENISFAGNCFTANKTGNYDIEINGSKYIPLIC